MLTEWAVMRWWANVSLAVRNGAVKKNVTLDSKVDTWKMKALFWSAERFYNVCLFALVCACCFITCILFSGVSRSLWNRETRVHFKSESPAPTSGWYLRVYHQRSVKMQSPEDSWIHSRYIQPLIVHWIFPWWIMSITVHFQFTCGLQLKWVKSRCAQINSVLEHTGWLQYCVQITVEYNWPFICKSVNTSW